MKKSVVIGISGGSGSGKTTLAKKLKEHFFNDVTLLCQDHYYRSFSHLTHEERKKLNFDHPSAFDIDLLAEHLNSLINFKPINRPVYSFIENNRLEDTVLEEPRTVIILEGILVFEFKQLLDLMDIKVFVDTDSDIRFARRISRDIHQRGRSVDSIINQYLRTVKPMHEAFVEPSKKYADIIIPEGGLNHVAYSMLVDKIDGILKHGDKDHIFNKSF